jgi:hypothetical protein
MQQEHVEKYCINKCLKAEMNTSSILHEVFGKKIHINRAEVLAINLIVDDQSNKLADLDFCMQRIPFLGI